MRPLPRRPNQAPPKSTPTPHTPDPSDVPQSDDLQPDPRRPTGRILSAPRADRAPRPHPLSPARFPPPPPHPFLLPRESGPAREPKVRGLYGSGAALTPGQHAAQAQTLTGVNARWSRAGPVPGEAHLPGPRQRRRRLVLRLLVRLARKEGAKARELKKKRTTHSYIHKRGPT